MLEVVQTCGSAADVSLGTNRPDLPWRRYNCQAVRRFTVVLRSLVYGRFVICRNLPTSYGLFASWASQVAYKMVESDSHHDIFEFRT